MYDKDRAYPVSQSDDSDTSFDSDLYTELEIQNMNSKKKLDISGASSLKEAGGQENCISEDVDHVTSGAGETNGEPEVPSETDSIPTDDSDNGFINEIVESDDELEKKREYDQKDGEHGIETREIVELSEGRHLMITILD